METMELLKKFGRSNEKCRRISDYIMKQNPMQYEAEYGAELMEWGEQNLLDFFVYKMKFYKMFSLGNVMAKYNIFYKYCVEQGYIKWNPLQDSKYLSAEYIQSEIIEAGNLPYYTRDYIKQKCMDYTDNQYYYLSIALSVFEGIRNYKELAKIKYTDVDFKTGAIRGHKGITISQELLEYYRKLHEMEYFVSNKKRYFDDGNKLLIRRIMKIGETALKTDNARNLSAAMKRTGLVQSVLYDSGLICRLCTEMGGDKLVQFMLYQEETNKADKITNNRELKEVFERLGINMSVKNFVYDYRVYALAIKYGTLDI